MSNLQEIIEITIRNRFPENIYKDGAAARIAANAPKRISNESLLYYVEAALRAEESA